MVYAWSLSIVVRKNHVAASRHDPPQIVPPFDLRVASLVFRNAADVTNFADELM
jgi:hypothetical protein